MPLLLLVVLEFLLRAAIDDPVTSLVMVREDRGRQYYQLNPRVGERFFSPGVAAIPEVYPQRFAYQKTPRTLRVFCLGSSTMASFPYELNARVSSLLQDRLQTLLPDKNVEVINAGMAAINSYAVCEFVRELVHYQPDLFVMYMGHNEYYGALGVGSTQSLGHHRSVIRAYLRLQKLRTFQVLRRLLLAARTSQARPASSSIAANQSLMETLARDKSIRFGSEGFHLGEQQFQHNLEDIIAVAQQHRVPILVATLCSNLRDMAPFASTFAPQRTEAERRQWQRDFDHGWRLQRADSVEAALAFFQKAAAIDEEPALLHFRLGQAHEERADTLAAQKEFVRARDLDPLRFRAPSSFNEIIRATCKKHEVPVVEMEAVFARHSRHGLIGRELISEHLHPNFAGYYLMAKTFSEAIMAGNIVQTLPMKSPTVLSDDYFRDLAAVTAFDLEIGARKIANLTGRWPFQREQFARDTSPEATPAIVQQLVEDYQSKKIAWNTGHVKLAEHYQSQGQFEQAQCEYRAVIKVSPEDETAHARLADLQIHQQRYAEAESTLQNALAFNDASPFLHAKLGLVKFLEHDFGMAAVHFQKSLEVNRRRQVFPISDLASAHYYLALSQIQNGNLQPARENLETTVRYQPTHPEAGRLLALIKSGAAIELRF